MRLHRAVVSLQYERRLLAQVCMTLLGAKEQIPWDNDWKFKIGG